MKESTPDKPSKNTNALERMSDQFLLERFKTLICHSTLVYDADAIQEMEDYKIEIMRRMAFSGKIRSCMAVDS